MGKYLSESEVLKKLDIQNFRSIPKDKIISFATMLPNMKPEVAKKALEQFPEFAKMSLEILKDYKDIMNNTIDANSDSSKKCFDIYNEVVNALKSCLEKDDLPFEEKKYYIEKMIEISRMAESKDTENKEFNFNIAKLGTVAVFTALSVSLTLLGVKTDIKIPKLK